LEDGELMAQRHVLEGDGRRSEEKRTEERRESEQRDQGSARKFKRGGPNGVFDQERVWVEPETPIPTVGPTVGQPGLYEAAKYCDTGLFRPTYDSKMRTLDRPFEQVNSEQLVKRFYNWVSPIDGLEPVDSTITLQGGGSQTFRARTPQPLTHALDVVWRVDGQTRGTGRTFILSSSGLAAGLHTVEVTITDPTPFVRSDPAQVLTDTARWDVTVIPANRSPDATHARASLATIWPPDHRLVSVQIFGVTDPDGDSVRIRIDRIMQDEMSEATGDGRTCPDAGSIGTATGHLRAERSGNGNGRVYWIFFSASDARGGSASGIVKTYVPHSKSGLRGRRPVVRLHHTPPHEVTNVPGRTALRE